jgi:hypothetical protein
MVKFDEKIKMTNILVWSEYIETKLVLHPFIFTCRQLI